MKETAKMNEAMYERLGEIAKFASNKRIELDPDFKGAKTDETQNRLMLAAFRELRSMVEFYKPEEKENTFLEFCGLKLNRFGAPGLGAKLIGKRVNVDKTVQVFEIELKRGNLATGARAFVTENGELLFSLVGGKSFAAVEQMAVSALHRLLDRRRESNSRKHRARKARAASAKNGGKI